jgi:hypothetical protein
LCPHARTHVAGFGLSAIINTFAELAVAPLIILASKLHENRGRSLLSCPYG